MKLLEAIDFDPKGKDAVVVGASNIVGRPMALELLLAGATVTVCHRFTRDLAEQVRRAELLVAAVGKPGLVKGEWSPTGAWPETWNSRRRANGPPGSPPSPAAWAP